MRAVGNNADWIWNYHSLDSSDRNTVFFETKISSNVPESATIILLGLTLAGLSMRTRRYIQ